MRWQLGKLRALHQTPSLLKPASVDMDTPMVITLLVAVAMFTVMYLAMMVKLVELGSLEEQVILNEHANLGPVAGAAVRAPSLGGEA